MRQAGSLDFPSKRLQFATARFGPFDKRLECRNVRGSRRLRHCDDYRWIRQVGKEARNGRLGSRAIGGRESAIGVEIRELNILMSGDVAAAFMLHRTSGTLNDGREVDYWVRATVCSQRSKQGWLIKHEHISVPVDLKSGLVIRDAVP